MSLFIPSHPVASLWNYSKPKLLTMTCMPYRLSLLHFYGLIFYHSPSWLLTSLSHESCCSLNTVSLFYLRAFALPDHLCFCMAHFLIQVSSQVSLLEIGLVWSPTPSLPPYPYPASFFIIKKISLRIHLSVFLKQNISSMEDWGFVLFTPVFLEPRNLPDTY